MITKTQPSQQEINRLVDLVHKGVGVTQIKQITGIPCTEQKHYYDSWKINKSHDGREKIKKHS